MALNNDQTLEFCAGFLGYGNPAAPLWFVGMEEGGGNSESEITARFDAWGKRGKRAFEDLRAFCRETGHADLQPWASTNAPRQKTWCGLIKEKGLREDNPGLIHDPVTYQRTEWLTEDGKTCLVNLMPLPSPGIDSWNYMAWSNLSILPTRKAYIAAFVDARIALIREAIHTHQPERVIFVGLTNAPFWNRIAEGMVESKFDTIEHPASRTREEGYKLISTSNVLNTSVNVAKRTEKGEIMPQTDYSSFLTALSTNLGVNCKPRYPNAWVIGSQKFQINGRVESDDFYASFPNGHPFRIELTLQKTGDLAFNRLAKYRAEIESALDVTGLPYVPRWESAAERGTKRALIYFYYVGDDVDSSRLTWGTNIAKALMDTIAKHANLHGV